MQKHIFLGGKLIQKRWRENSRAVVIVGTTQLVRVRVKGKGKDKRKRKGKGKGKGKGAFFYA